MPQSLVNNCIQIIFSTKHRNPLILPPYENKLNSYLGGICRMLDCQPIKIGGYTDHVHVFCKLSKKIALMDFLEPLKKDSSKWVKTLDRSLKNFYWQDGYGAFSVNPSQIAIVIKYIENQHEHHKKISYQDEFRAFLKKHKIDLDEKYVWD